MNKHFKILSVFIVAISVVLAGCSANMGVKERKRSNAHAQASGESHIDAIGALARKLQREQLCTEGLKAHNQNPEVNVSMGITDDTGDVTWLNNSSTGRETGCEYQ